MQKKFAHFYCYGNIGENDPLFKVFTGEDDPFISTQKVIDFLAEMPKDTTDILIHINSRGGSVDEGFAIHDLFKLSGKKVTTRIEGQCASIATVVLMCGDERECSENGTGLIHNPWIDPSIIAGLTAAEIHKIADDVEREETRILDFYVEKTGASRDTLKSYMKEEKKFSASELLELKFITKIAEPVKAFAYHIPKKQPMATEKKSLASQIYDLIIGHIKGEDGPQASSKKTSDGKEIYFEGSLAVGTKVFSDAEMKTPCADGSISMEDGSTVSVEGGAVKEITEKTEASAEKEIEKLNAQIATLTKERDEAIAAKADEKVIQAAVEEAVTKIKAEFKSEFKPAVSGTQFKQPEKKETLAEFNARMEKEKKK